MLGGRRLRGLGLGLLGCRLGGRRVVAGLGGLDILELLGQGLDVRVQAWQQALVKTDFKCHRDILLALHYSSLAEDPASSRPRHTPTAKAWIDFNALRTYSVKTSGPCLIISAPK